MKGERIWNNDPTSIIVDLEFPLSNFPLVIIPKSVPPSCVVCFEQKAAIPYTRFVRIYATRDLSAYGMQIKGMAVLTDLYIATTLSILEESYAAPKSTCTQRSSFTPLPTSIIVDLEWCDSSYRVGI